MIPWLVSLSVDIRSWVFPVNIYTWIKSLFTSSSSVNPRSTDENQGEASRKVTGFCCTSHPSGVVQVTFQPPSHFATTFWKVTSFCCTSQKCVLQSMSLVRTFTLPGFHCHCIPFFLGKSWDFCCISNLVLLSRAHLYIYQSTLALLWELRIILVDRWT